MYWTFESVADFAEYLERYARDKRQQSTVVARVKDRDSALTEAMAYEAMADIIRNSNLARSRLILMDDDIQEGLREIDAVVAALTSASGTLASVAGDLGEKRSELAAMQSEELPSGSPASFNIGSTGSHRQLESP